MMTVQIPIDERLLVEINNVSKPLGLDLAKIIGEALLAWLKRHEGHCFEQEWIAAFRKHPDDAGRAEEWLETQTWSAS